MRSFTTRAVTSPAPAVPFSDLPSPPPSPPLQMWSSSQSSSPSVTSSMDRSLLHGGSGRGDVNPPQGHQSVKISHDASSSQDARSVQMIRSSQDARYSQEARSNFPIQPAADSGTFKLKKKAVKIVGAAGSAAGAPLSKPSSRLVASVSKPTMTSLSTPVSPPALGLIKEQNPVIEFVYACP